MPACVFHVCVHFVVCVLVTSRPRFGRVAPGPVTPKVTRRSHGTCTQHIGDHETVMPHTDDHGAVTRHTDDHAEITRHMSDHGARGSRAVTRWSCRTRAVTGRSRGGHGEVTGRSRTGGHEEEAVLAGLAGQHPAQHAEAHTHTHTHTHHITMRGRIGIRRGGGALEVLPWEADPSRIRVGSESDPSRIRVGEPDSESGPESDIRVGEPGPPQLPPPRAGTRCSASESQTRIQVGDSDSSLRLGFRSATRIQVCDSNSSP